AGVRAHHAIALGVVAAKVALNRAQHFWIVVHRQHHWLWHSIPMKYAALWLLVGALRFAQPSRYNLGLSMSSPLASAIADLSSSDPVMRSAAATEIYRRGRAPADRAGYIWWTNPEFAPLFGAPPAVTVGLAVRRETFARIRDANGSPTLVSVPPFQDAEEFELHFP